MTEEKIDLIKKGLLKKRLALVDAIWIERFVFLNGSQLYVFEEREDTAIKPAETFSMVSCWVEGIDVIDQYFCFTLRCRSLSSEDDQVITLGHRQHQETKKWMIGIRRAIDQVYQCLGIPYELSSSSSNFSTRRRVPFTSSHTRNSVRVENGPQPPWVKLARESFSTKMQKRENVPFSCCYVDGDIRIMNSHVDRQYSLWKGVNIVNAGVDIVARCIMSNPLFQSFHPSVASCNTVIRLRHNSDIICLCLTMKETLFYHPKKELQLLRFCSTSCGGHKTIWMKNADTNTDPFFLRIRIIPDEIGEEERCLVETLLDWTPSGLFFKYIADAFKVELLKGFEQMNLFILKGTAKTLDKKLSEVVPEDVQHVESVMAHPMLVKDISTGHSYVLQPLKGQVVDELDFVDTHHLAKITQLADEFNVTRNLAYRFLKGTNWEANIAGEKMSRAIDWRKSYKPNHIHEHEILHELSRNW
eukprot:CAMPEP_0115010650 /NCGR_PEP_ID=MMETSP0216-20121206/23452_1 /TAXON_ID=223996 /ORGANISM="Protocruzia adherens, Strain Boccale" /LENGTH=471 /DNA_ID=CAMNT_0002378925 /DNA_START=248 /DNA_END=1660 /DNA_ORIENTATION=+